MLEPGLTRRPLDPLANERPPSCLNCDTALPRERFCPRCGQSAAVGRLHVLSLAREWAIEFFDIDNRWLTTLRGLFPEAGTMAARYVAGKRVRYVNPARFFLICAASLIAADWVVASRAGYDQPELVPPYLLAMWIPAYAALLAIIFRSYGRTVAETACFSFYVGGVVLAWLVSIRVFIGMALSNEGDAWDQWLDRLLLPSLAALALYIGVSAARFFRTGWIWATVATAGSVVLLTVLLVFLAKVWN